MNTDLDTFYKRAQEHQVQHKCTGVPFQFGNLLSVLVTITDAKKVLEIGTGVGYSAACLAKGSTNTMVDTIDKDPIHVAFAKEKWEELKLEKRISSYLGKAEEVLSTFNKEFDFIFFDGAIPMVKLLPYFENLLKKNGILLTANLFLRDKTGGRYLTQLNNLTKWKTVLIEDNALSVKII
jgi:predicted O-methyltransferase YrrM